MRCLCLIVFANGSNSSSFIAVFLDRAVGLMEVNESIKPFDWTYTTDYRGTLTSKGGASFQVSTAYNLRLHRPWPTTLTCCVLQVSETDERIDYEKLKKQEKIYFYDDVILYEDELADNGTAVLNVKVVRASQLSSLVVSIMLF